MDEYGGSEDDVLRQFSKAAKLSMTNLVERLCVDNPFVPSREIDLLVEFSEFITCDYAFNQGYLLDNGYADDFGLEFFSTYLLFKTDDHAKEGSAKGRAN